MTTKGIGGHQSAAARTDNWITPREIVTALGDFDLDPCAHTEMPWQTAARQYTVENDGLRQSWDGRVWLNPPYGREAEAWLRRLADHNHGTALIFARTETSAFFAEVWRRAAALLFIESRLHFHYPDGRAPFACDDDRHQWERRPEEGAKAEWCIRCGKAKANGGAPSVLIAYGLDDADVLADCEIEGAFVPLSCTGQTVVVLRHAAPEITWGDLLTAFAERNGGRLDLQAAYTLIKGHPKAKRNPNWRAKVRQTFARAGFERTGAGQYALPA